MVPPQFLAALFPYDFPASKSRVNLERAKFEEVYPLYRDSPVNPRQYVPVNDTRLRNFSKSLKFLPWKKAARSPINGSAPNGSWKTETTHVERPYPGRVPSAPDTVAFPARFFFGRSCQGSGVVENRLFDFTPDTLTKDPSQNKLSFSLSLFMEVHMQQVNIHEAKTNLSKLIQKAVQGESFIIAKSGKPMVTVSAYTPPMEPAKRTGFLKAGLEIPEDFDSLGKEEIQAMFEGRNETAP
jgi:antitoxin (DNA-binding transcriptional repressor) of toxin-antitoxin stability system